MKRMRLRTLALYTIMLPLAPVALGAEYDLSWHSVVGGGGTDSIGGNLTLSGSIGQPDAGPAMTGGELSMTGGFWPGSEAFCYADLTGDGRIGLADLAQLLGHYGETDATYEDGDLDGDGDVDLSDLAELLGMYGTVCP